MICSVKAWLCGVCLLLAPRAIAADAVIVVAPDASALVQLAAREVNRYVYLRTGERLPVRPAATAGRDSIRLLIDKGLGAQAYRMKTAGGAATRPHPDSCRGH